MPTLLECPDIIKNAALCSELGFQFVEINMNLPMYQAGIIDVRQIHAARKQYDIYFTVHMDENFTAVDFNPYLENAYLRTMTETIALAKRHQIPVITMHMTEGIHFKLPHQKVFLFDKYMDIYLNKLQRFRDLCERAIGDGDIHICIENCNGFHPFMRQGIDLLLESEKFGLTMDTGHNHCARHIDEPFLLQKRKKLTHLHLHDANGKTCHLPLGSGEIDIKEKLLMAEALHCRVVLEVKTAQGLILSKEWLAAQ